MSIFASRTTKTIAVPFDPPHEVTIQKLAGRHLARAQQEDQVASVEALKRMGGPAFQKELEGLGDPEKRAALVKEHQSDPVNAYDRYTVLARGIKAWTYEESLVPVQVLDDDGVTRMRIPAIDDLDDDAALYFAREILRLTKPSLFMTETEAETDRKNDSRSSTAP